MCVTSLNGCLDCAFASAARLLFPFPTLVLPIGTLSSSFGATAYSNFGVQQKATEAESIACNSIQAGWNAS